MDSQKKSKIRMIKSVKQLPAWFKLENYAQTSTLDAEGWYRELSIRFLLKDLPQCPEDATWQKLWALIQSQGLLSRTPEAVPFKFSFYSSQIKRFQVIQPESQYDQGQSVECLTNLTAYAAYWWSEKDVQETVIKNLKIMVDKPEGSLKDNPGENAVSWLMQPFDSFPHDIRLGIPHKYAYARVDLETTDEQLKKDFSDWLANERQRRQVLGAKKNFSEADFRGFEESAILPYLDLTLWAVWAQVKINQYVMAQAIFPDAYAPDSEIDPLGRLKTTKKKSESLMQPQPLIRLESQTGLLRNTKDLFYST